MLEKKLLMCAVLTIGLCAVVPSFSAEQAVSAIKTIWTPTFYAIEPRLDVDNPVPMDFCLTHIPNTLRTTIDQIKQGVQAENGVFIRYLSYETTYEHGLGFNTVNAQVWLEDSEGNETWHSPLWEYQQNLSDTGVTNVVWATQQCKGKFLGVSNQS
jgi:hypothetical protein